MKTLLVFLLKIISDLTIIAGEDAVDTSEIMCQFMGASSGSGYRFNKDDVHKCCSSVVYGYYFLDGKWDSDYHVVPRDREPITTLVNDGKVVYVMVGFLETDQWLNVFFPPDNNEYNTLRDTLIRFLTDSKVKGLLLDKPNLYIGAEGLDEKINLFAGEIKSKVSDVKIGIIIDGIGYKNFSNEDSFSFSITNENVDIYLIDTTTANECNQETQKNGILPIQGADGNLISLEQMLTAASSSSMDKSKLYARMDVSVRVAHSQGSILPPISYSEFCPMKDQSQCCPDNSQTIYEKGKYVKQLNYKGIMLSMEEYDDFDGKCGCDKFPMTNRIIGGWENKPVEPPCPKLDKP